jgi:hypothetical protein
VAAPLRADEPSLAVFAAQRTNDEVFIGRIRKTAGARLRARAREALDAAPHGAHGLSHRPHARREREL